MSVNNCILTPQNNKPVMCIVQDALVGAYLLTSPDCFVEKWLFCDLIATMFPESSAALPQPALIKPERWKGTQLVSMLLPDDFQLTTPHLTIVDGVIVDGRLCKKSLGKVERGIIHLLCLHYGNDVAARFISQIQRLVNAWMTHRSLSTGISDCVVDVSTNKCIAKDLREAQRAAMGLVVNDGREADLNRDLNMARDEVAQHALHYIERLGTDKHGMMMMARAGSKGSRINIAQITTCVGQQNVMGKRIKHNNGGRVLPHYTQHETLPEASGFCANSYISGLKPSGFFMHMMAGREGLIDTAIKTSETGYLERRLIKCTENIKASRCLLAHNVVVGVIWIVFLLRPLLGILLQISFFVQLRPQSPPVERIDTLHGTVAAAAQQTS